MSEHLPQEVLIEIFLRLPTKSIIQCTSVCKSWYSLITSPNFISLHLNNQEDDYLLVRHCSGEPVKEIYGLYYDNETFDQYVQFDMPFVCQSHFNIVGNCNGLLCLSDDLWNYRDVYYIWNPSIRKSVKLPKPIFTFQTHGPFDHTLGFGFDPVTNDYKVVRIVHTGDNLDRIPPYVELYKLSTGVWQDITRVAPSYLFFPKKPGVDVNGACHWVATKREKGDSRNMIVMFDMEDETFWEMMVPGRLVAKFCFSGDWLALFVSEESLCLADRLGDDDETIDIWRMKEYGDPESWVKQFSISLRHITFDVVVVDEFFSRFHGGRQRQVAHFLEMLIGSRKNGEFFWRADNGLLVSYNPAAEKIKNLGIHNANRLPYHFALYVNTYKVSLMLLGKRTNSFAGDTFEESSNLSKRECKVGREVLKGKTKRGLHILSPLRISSLMHMSKIKAKRLHMIKRKSRFQADFDDLL